jgi:hypothetical protein
LQKNDLKGIVVQGCEECAVIVGENIEVIPSVADEGGQIGIDKSGVIEYLLIGQVYKLAISEVVGVFGEVETGGIGDDFAAVKRAYHIGH